ncbi:hypothetical protein ABIA33_000697 [Streptacidiphilus sp. MAP12-16]
MDLAPTPDQRAGLRRQAAPPTRSPSASGYSGEPCPSSDRHTRGRGRSSMDQPLPRVSAVSPTRERGARCRKSCRSLPTCGGRRGGTTACLRAMDTWPGQGRPTRPLGGGPGPGAAPNTYCHQARLLAVDHHSAEGVLSACCRSVSWAYGFHCTCSIAGAARDDRTRARTRAGAGGEFGLAAHDRRGARLDCSSSHWAKVCFPLGPGVVGSRPPSAICRAPAPGSRTGSTQRCWPRTRRS